MLVVAMSIQAQSIVGTWKTTPEKDEVGDLTTWQFTFNQGMKATMRMTLETYDPEVGKIVFAMDMPGTYSLSGKTLDVSFDPSKSTAKVEMTEFTGEMAELFNSSPEMKKAILDMLQKQVDTEMKKNFADHSPFDGAITILKLTATQLELQADDEIMKFTRVR